MKGIDMVYKKCFLALSFPEAPLVSHHFYLENIKNLSYSSSLNILLSPSSIKKLPQTQHDNDKILAEGVGWGREGRRRRYINGVGKA